MDDTLIIPPGFNLMPPSPGAAPTNTLQTDAQAQAAMFGAGDTTSIAANIQGNYSPAERMLLDLLQQFLSERQGAVPADPIAHVRDASVQEAHGGPTLPVVR